MKQTVIGLVVGAIIGAGAMWAFGGKDSTRETTGSGPSKAPVYPVLMAYDSTVGSNPGATPHFTTPVLPAGSTIIFSCANNNCASVSGAAGSGSSTMSAQVLFEAKVPNDLPANTQLLLSYRLAPAKQQASK